MTKKSSAMSGRQSKFGSQDLPHSVPK